jgi:hypothetical protein
VHCSHILSDCVVSCRGLFSNHYIEPAARCAPIQSDTAHQHPSGSGGRCGHGQQWPDALSLDSPSATGVVLRAGVVPPSAKEKQVTVNFAIDPHTLGFERKDDGLQHIMVSCAVAAFSEKGSFLKEEVSSVTAAMKADEFEKMMKGQQFPCKRTINLKPGNYNLTLGVVDRNSGLIGTTTAWVKVP